MQVVILAGGLGTRLRSVVNDRPKPMALVNNKPFLEYIISNLERQGLKNIILATGYMHDFIKDYFGNGEKLQVNIKYAVEEEQLGTAGAIKNAENLIEAKDILILNGDTYFNVDYNQMLENHIKNKSIFTIALRKVKDARRYGAVECDSHNKITNFIEKGKESNSSFINGGVYIVNKDILRFINKDKKVSLENEVIPNVLRERNVYGFNCDNYFIDIGIPEDYSKFINDVLGGEYK